MCYSNLKLIPRCRWNGKFWRNTVGTQVGRYRTNRYGTIFSTPSCHLQQWVLLFIMHLKYRTDLCPVRKHIDSNLWLVPTGVADTIRIIILPSHSRLFSDLSVRLLWGVIGQTGWTDEWEMSCVWRSSPSVLWARAVFIKGGYLLQ